MIRSGELWARGASCRCHSRFLLLGSPGFFAVGRRGFLSHCYAVQVTSKLVTQRPDSTMVAKYSRQLPNTRTHARLTLGQWWPALFPSNTAAPSCSDTTHTSNTRTLKFPTAVTNTDVDRLSRRTSSPHTSHSFKSL